MTNAAIPPLEQIDSAGVHPWQGDPAELAAAAHARDYAFFHVDLSAVDSKKSLLEALSKSYHFGPHFGHNWDALADSLTDFSHISAQGYVTLVTQSALFRKHCDDEIETLTDIWLDSADYWREHERPFWVFVS